MTEKRRKRSRPNLKWEPIIERAREIVNSYPERITLRRLFYGLVSEGLLDNSTKDESERAYDGLIDHTTTLRRVGQFPPLLDIDTMRGKDSGFMSPQSALVAVIEQYRCDRTQGQPYQIYVGVEKKGLYGDLVKWFDAYGVRLFALGGFGAEAYERELIDEVERDVRPAVLIYGGDCDPSGERIYLNLIKNTQSFRHVEHVGVTEQQIDDYDLPVMRFTKNDSRIKEFRERHSIFCQRYGLTKEHEAFQVEIDAFDAYRPDVLRQLYTEAFMKYWDVTAYKAVIEQEAYEREQLIRHAETFRG